MRVQLMLDGIAMFDSEERDHAPGLVKALAVAWCGMTDDDQAKFFEEVGRIMDGWDSEERPRQAFYLGADHHRHLIGRHMRDCACIGDAGRRALTDIYSAMVEVLP